MNSQNFIDLLEGDKGWEMILEDFVRSKRMYNIYKAIKNDSKSFTIYPKPRNMFKAFSACPYNQLKVVILGQDPYADGSATGIAFANTDYKANGTLKDNMEPLSPSLMKIVEAMDEQFGFQAAFVDYSFETLSKQGVLLLNSALTVRRYQFGSHVKVWQPFTEYVITKLNEEHTGLIFVFLGKQAQEYAKYVQTSKNYVIKHVHPSYSCRKNESWKFDFKKINEIIEANNGKEYTIDWGKTA